MTPLRIPPQTPTASQLTWFWVAMGNTQGSRGFTFGRLTDKQARKLALLVSIQWVFDDDDELEPAMALNVVTWSGTVVTRPRFTIRECQ